MGIVYDRDNRDVFEGDGPKSGTYGQISFERLCDLLEAGPYAIGERVTHIEARRDGIRYRIEKR